MGDLRLEGELTAADDLTYATVVLREGRYEYRFRIPGPAAPSDAQPENALFDGVTREELPAEVAEGFGRLKAGQ